MDALTLLRDQAAMAHDLMTQVFAPVTTDQAVWRAPGSTANLVGATFLHAYFSEDGLVQRSQGRPTLFDSGGWQQRTGLDPAALWTSSDRPDPDALRAYAAEVAAATRAYLEGVSPDALVEEVNSPVGKRSRAVLFSLLLLTHKGSHMGEIAALLGCQGVKGFPF